jgi:phosphoglycolate phosphatase-like HAD superfamily hydrolase
MLELIVFDCDGVMFDSKEANRKYYNFLLKQFGCGKMNEDEADFVHMHSVKESLAYIFRNCKNISVDDVNKFRQKISYEPFLQYMTMEPDLLPFLEQARPFYSLAISTNRTNTMRPLLESYGLAPYFGKVMTAANATRPKPAPDALLEILDFYNCSPENALFIGDSIIDEQHAASCKVDLIAFKSPEINAKYYVSSFMEILDLPPLKKSSHSS